MDPIRSLHDSLCVVKRTLESGYVVAGGGAVEIALSIYLEDYSRTLETKEQTAVAEFCEALNIIPKVLASNAAQDATELVSKLRALHAASQSSEDPAKKELRHCGLDLVLGKVRNNVKAGVLEPMVSKIKSIRYILNMIYLYYNLINFINLKIRHRSCYYNFENR